MSDEAVEAHGRGRAETKYFFLSRGSRVELCTDEKGFEGAWFGGVVVDPPGKRRSETALVRFNRAGMLFVKTIRVELIRPLPPSHLAAAALEPNDVVDALRDGAWRTGFVVRVTGERWTVAFKNPDPDVLVVSRSELRAHWDWVGSTWVKPQKEVPLRSLFGLASEVEMDLDEGNSGITWFPTVSLGEVGVNCFMLKISVSTDDKNFEKELVHAKRIRPRPPQIQKKSFELLEKVDAFFGSCWSFGVVTRILQGQRYTVTFRHVKKESDFNHTELRPHLDWIDGKWVINSKGVLSTSDCQEQSRPSCNESKSVELITLDERSGSPRESLCSSTQDLAKEGTSCLIHRPSNQKELSSVVEKSPYLESSNKDEVNHTSNGDNSAEVVPIRDHEVNLQTAKVEKPTTMTQRHGLRVYARRHHYPQEIDHTIQMHQSTEPAVDSEAGAQVSQISGNVFPYDQALSMDVAETNLLANVGVSGNVEPTVMPNLPFAKSCPIWKVLESMEVFKKFPQEPHFKPLLNLSFVNREGAAFGHMVTFTNLIEKIHKLQENDSSEHIDKILESLSAFEELGFDIKVFQDHLNEMRTTKAKVENLQERLKGVEHKIKECTDEVSKVDGKVAEIDCKIGKIIGKRAMWMSERMESQSKIIKLTSEAIVINSSLSCASKSLRSLVVMRPW